MQARGNYYHVNCFRCLHCKLLMKKGQRFGIKNQEIYCEHHYLLFSSTNDNDTNNNVGGEGGGGDTTIQKLGEYFLNFNIFELWDIHYCSTAVETMDSTL